MIKKQDDFSQFDIRVIERKIKKGEISQKAYDKWLQSLPESSDYEEIDEESISLESEEAESDTEEAESDTEEDEQQQ